MIHTGQHYDDALSQRFFQELRLPPAAVNLGVGSGPHGRQTGQMLDRLERVLLELRPDVVVTYGDTNSTLAGALAAVKLHLPVARVEAGVRSFDRRMPEEVNRVAADHVADLLLAPTPTAVANLEKEGLGERTVLTGDLMYDAVLAVNSLALQHSEIQDRLGVVPGSYGVVTIHRAENTDDLGRLTRLTTALNAVAEHGLRLIFLQHPRTARALEQLGWRPHPAISLLPPAGYLDTLALLARARVALTDSGGLQKEAFFLGCPTVTLRDRTEWVETVQGGGNLLADADPDRVVAAVATWAQRYPSGRADFTTSVAAAFGDGHAAERIRDAVLALVDRTRARQP